MIYGDIKSGFLSLLNRRDCTQAQADTFLQNGILKINRELRCPAMERILTLEIDDMYKGGIPIPTDFLELQSILNSQGNRVVKEDMATVLHLARGNDFPTSYVRLGAQWLLGPNPLLNDVVVVTYYASLPPLLLPTDQCALTQIAGDLFTYAGLTYAGDFYTDKRSDKWEQRYEQIKGDLQGMADADELSGGTNVSPAIIYPDDHQDDF